MFRMFEDDLLIAVSAPKGVISGPCSPKITVCVPPSENCAFPKRGLCPEKKVTGPVLLEWISGQCPPKNCLCPPSGSEISFQNEKHVWTPKLSLRFCTADLFFWVFTLEYAWARSAPLDSAAPRQAIYVLPRVRLVPRKKVKCQDLFFGLLSRRCG